MELFTRMAVVNFSLKQVKYHPKSSRLKITTLMFIDDVMIFTKPELPSMQSIIGLLDAFYRKTGLSLNINKSSMLCTWVPSLIASKLHHVIGYKEWQMICPISVYRC